MFVFNSVVESYTAEKMVWHDYVSIFFIFFLLIPDLFNLHVYVSGFRYYTGQTYFFFREFNKDCRGLKHKSPATQSSPSVVWSKTAVVGTKIAVVWTKISVVWSKTAVVWTKIAVAGNKDLRLFNKDPACYLEQTLRGLDKGRRGWGQRSPVV